MMVIALPYDLKSVAFPKFLNLIGKPVDKKMTGIECSDAIEQIVEFIEKKPDTIAMFKDVLNNMALEQ